MKITSKGRYGLKAMLELAQNSSDSHLLKSRQISERQNIPLKYLEQIIAALRKSDLLVSVRGSEGGYCLARSPDQITVLEVLSALEGPLSLSIVDPKDRTWTQEQGSFWQELEEKIHSFLKIPLNEFAKNKMGSRDKLMYYI